MMQLSRSAFTRLVLALLLLAPVGYANGGEVIDGKWELNVAKSKFDPGPPIKSQSRTYSTSGDMQTVAISGVNATAESMSSQTSYRLDGKDYPVKGSPEIDAISMTKVDNTTARGTTKRAGKVVSNISRTVSDDGKTLTVTVKGMNPAGQPFNNTLVFDRK